jgi:transcriptional regulator with XRE-family HTH domain
MGEHDELPSLDHLVRELFRRYRHPDGREYTQKEVEESIAKAVGKRLIDASTISKMQSGALRNPGLDKIEALCYFFPVEIDYFFPGVVAFRQRQNPQQSRVHAFLRSAGTDPDLLREQLEGLLRLVASDEADSGEGTGEGTVE